MLIFILTNFIDMKQQEPRNKTEQQLATLIDSIINNVTILNKFNYLRMRWLEKSETEKWEDYENEMKIDLEKFDIEFVSGRNNKHSFGFVFDCKYSKESIVIYLKLKGEQIYLVSRAASLMLKPA